jgi:hypothetical protein
MLWLCGAGSAASVLLAVLQVKEPQGWSSPGRLVIPLAQTQVPDQQQPTSRSGLQRAKLEWWGTR